MWTDTVCIWAVTLSEADEASSCGGKCFCFWIHLGYNSAQTRRKKGTKAILYLSSSVLLVDSFLPAAAARWDTIACGERNHVEKHRSLPQHDKQMTLCGETLSSAQFIQMKRSSVPYQLTAFNQTLSTPSIIHPVCDSQLQPVFFLSFFFSLRTSVQRSWLVLPPSSSSSLNSVNMSTQPVGRCRNTTQHNKLPWEGKTYTNMSMHKILKRM